MVHNTLVFYQGRRYSTKVDRKLDKTLTDWKNRTNRKPLVIRGARQVGKTFLVREFAQQNFQTLVETMRPNEITEQLDKQHDWVLMESHIFNVGGYATLESMDWNEDTQEYANDNGYLFCDKDTFVNLLEF